MSAQTQTLLPSLPPQPPRERKTQTHPPQPPHPLIQPRRKHTIHIAKHPPTTAIRALHPFQLLTQKAHHGLESVRGADCEDPLPQLRGGADGLEADRYCRGPFIHVSPGLFPDGWMMEEFGGCRLRALLRLEVGRPGGGGWRWALTDLWRGCRRRRHWRWRGRWWRLGGGR